MPRRNDTNCAKKLENSTGHGGKFKGFNPKPGFLFGRNGVCIVERGGDEAVVSTAFEMVGIYMLERGINFSV